MIYFDTLALGVDPTEYAKQRLKNLPDTTLPVVDAVPLLVAAGDLEGAAETVAMVRKAAAELFPLAPGERMESEELLALLNAADRDGASLLLRQTTNFARTSIPVPERVVSGNRIVEGRPDSVAEDRAVETAAVVPAWALALAKQLGQKLLEQLGSALWDVVRKEVLGKTDLPSYYVEVYDELRRIVASAFDAHYLREVQDLTTKFADTMSYYNNMGRKEVDFLLVKNTSFDLITKSNRLGFPGAFHYAEASVLHVMTLRESYKRLIEEKKSPDELKASKAYISSLCTQFADNVTIKHGQLLAARMATISREPFQHHWTVTNSPVPGRTIGGVREGVFDQDAVFLYSCAPVQNMFRDSTNGFWNSMYFHLFKEAVKPGNSWNWVNNNLQRYRTQIHADTLRDLQPLLDVADRLRRLADAPYDA